MNKETIENVILLHEELLALRDAQLILDRSHTVLTMRNDYDYTIYPSCKYYMENILANAKESVMNEVKERINQIEKELEEL